MLKLWCSHKYVRRHMRNSVKCWSYDASWSVLSKSERLKALEFLYIFNFSFWSLVVFTHWTKHVQRRKVPVAPILLLVPKPHCSYLGTLKPFVGKPCKFLMLLGWRHCTAGWHFLLSDGPPVRATVSVWTAFGSVPVNPSILMSFSGYSSGQQSV